MTNLTATAGWDAVPQIETTTALLGGTGGPLNSPSQALLNRTEWLRALSVNVKDPMFSGGAKGDGVANDTAAILAAQAYCASLQYGATLIFPAGIYICDSTIPISPNVNIVGAGRLASQILYTGTGDGFKFSGPLNSYTNLRTKLSDFTVAAMNSANAGGGITLESCAYVEICNVYNQGFKYGHILDQVIHFRCSYSEITNTKRACVWVVNGADRRVGAKTGFTNNIWYGTEVQLNPNAVANSYCLQDDGGANHDYRGVNFNGGDVHARIAGVTSLVLSNCDSEGALSSPVYFTDTTRETGSYVGPASSFVVEALSASCMTPYEIVLDAAQDGRIEACAFGQYSAAAFFFASNKVANVRISNNSKLTTGPYRTAAPFFDASLNAVITNQNDVEQQPAVTYVAVSVTSVGSQTVTPASMEGIKVGTYLRAQNEDGTAFEQILVTSVSSTQFTANFSSQKAAYWTIQGQAKSVTEGTWTPTVIGTTTAGAQTYSTQAGYWKKQGNKVHVTGTVTISAKDAAMAGAVAIGGLPFLSVNVSNRNSTANFAFWSGLTFPANFTQLSGLIVPNTNAVALRRMGSGQSGAPVAVSELGASATFIFEATFYVS